MKKYFKLSIPKPCHEIWNDMTPKEKGRFCSSCSKTVVDFTQMNSESIQSYLHKNQGKRICGHIKQSQLDTINLQIPFQTFQKKMSFQRMFILSLLFVMGTSIMSCTGQNGKTKKIETIEVINTIKTKTCDTLNSKHIDSTQKTNIIENTIEGEMIIEEPPIEPVEVMGDIAVEGLIETNADFQEAIPISIVGELPKFFNTPKGISKKEELEYFRNKIKDLVNNNFNTEQYSKLGIIGKQRILIKFEINKEGNITNIKVRAPHSELEKEAIRVVKKFPKFIPAKHQDKEVAVTYVLPIIFTLND